MDKEPLTHALGKAPRLEALAKTGLIDAASDPALDRFTRLLRNSLDVPVALVSLVDPTRQFFTSAFGLPEPWASARETPLSHSFCKHVVVSDAPLVVDDALVHPLVRENLAVSDLSVRAYAGMPIRTAQGVIIGSFCAIDTEPRAWSERDLCVLADLCEFVSERIALRSQLVQAERAEASSAALNVRLQRAQDTQDQQARRAVHDLRSPLQVVATGLEHLRSHETLTQLPEVSRMIEIMQRNTEHAVTLVADLHASPDASPAGAITDVAALLREVTETMRLQGGLSVQERGCERPCWVQADSMALRRCIDNLLGNAARFATGQIQVELHTVGGHTLLAVEDDGPGLPSEEAHAEVFTPRTTFHGHEGKSGSGLGLSIVKETVESYGGRVAASPSITLGGARFVLTLPQGLDASR